MKTIFWIAVSLEITAIAYFLYQIWLIPSRYIEPFPELYRKNLLPAAVLFVIVVGALVARFYFQAPRAAFYISISPGILWIVSLVGMMLATMLLGGNWR